MTHFPGCKVFTEPGPVISAMMASRARVVGVMGPQGGGKTTGVIARILQKAAMQPPSPKDGIARYRCTVWMRSYRDLWSKVIPDWLEWLPQKSKEFSIEWNGGRDNPAEHRWSMRVIRDGREHIVRAEMWFRAIGDLTPQEAAKGIQTTDGWLPEATSASQEMMAALFGRIGRYPPGDHGGAPHRQVLCDWNAGDPYNWTTEYFLNNLPENAEFFRQPGGREANAENLHNLPSGYYEDQIEANKNDPDWIRRMVDNKIGFMKDGRPVYGDCFDDALHVRPNGLAPWSGCSLVIAADAGLSPAVTIGQRNSFGEWRILDALAFEPGTGARACGRALNKVLGSERYANAPTPKIAYADPTAGNPTESSDESDTAALKTWMAIMADETGLEWRRSRCGNDLEIRQESVRVALNRRVEKRPAVQIDGRRCHCLITALARDYKFARRRTVTGHGLEYSEKPDKGKASHIGNAFEYLMANGGEQEEAKAERAAKTRRARRSPTRAQTRSGPVDPFARMRSGRR